MKKKRFGFYGIYRGECEICETEKVVTQLPDKTVICEKCYKEEQN